MFQQTSRIWPVQKKEHSPQEDLFCKEAQTDLS
jgi:hypothetical protein